MADSPNYRFHSKPRFSVNQIAEYLTSGTANQREEIIRDAKFPGTAHSAPYTRSRTLICRLLGSNARDVSSLDAHIDRFDAEHGSLPSGEWAQKEAGRNRDALKAFKEGFNKTRWKRFTFVPGPTKVAMEISGVRINAWLDPTLTREQDGKTYRGGCATFFASTKPARKKIEERCKIVAALIHWTLERESEGGNLFPPLEAICLSFDVFGHTLTPAPTSIDRLRGNVTKSCAEAFTLWPTVTPPKDYDGPPWR